GTIPTTGIDDAVAELDRCAKMGLRTAQLESYPSGNFFEPSSIDDRFWAAAVERNMPINLHVMFFFNTGDLGGPRSNTPGQARSDAQNKLGLDTDAGRSQTILAKMILNGVFDRFPDFKFVLTETHAAWVPYSLEAFDESVKRNRLDPDAPKLKMLP